mgnify:CR=1 FL=1|jgi:hypothetical protein
MDYLKKVTGFKHAFVVWIPYGAVSVEKPWRRLWLTDHFEETGFAELPEKSEKDELSSHIPYLSSWNDRSKRARKKFLVS